GTAATPAARATGPSGSRGYARFGSSAFERYEGVATGVPGIAPQLLLDPEQLVVLGDAIAAAQRTRLDLRGRGGDRDVGDGGVFGLARPVRDDRRVMRRIRHGDRLERLGQRANLVD